MCNKVGSNGGATYVIAKIIANGNLNIANSCKSLKIFFSKITRQNSLILHRNSFWFVYVCEFIGKDNLNVTNIIRTFENLLLQNYSTEFFDILNKKSLDMCH